MNNISQPISAKPVQSETKKLTFTSRKRYNKTKLACRTCRTRKIRCDETIPFCTNCTKTGRVCDGVSASTKAKCIRFAAPLTLSHFAATQIGGAQYSSEEVNYLDLFRNRLIYSVVGRGSFVKPSSMKLILQAVHEEEAMRHAVIALSALASENSCINRTNRNGELGNSRFALYHYSKSLTALQDVFQREDTRSLNVALLCALICICFEIQVKYPILAQVHLEKSLRVLESSSTSVEDEIAMAFIRLDLQASTYLGARPPALSPNYAADRKLDHENIYHEVDDALTFLKTRLYRFLRSIANRYRYVDTGWIPLEVFAEAQSLQTELQEFRYKYLDDPFSKLTRSQNSLLTVNYLEADVTLATCLHPEETLFDQFSLSFTSIVDLCTEILSSRQENHPGETFSLDMGIIQPLYTTACKSRCPSTRRKAIQILQSCPEKEGVWDGAPNARVAEAIMEFEEEGLGFDLIENEDGNAKYLLIPEWRRVHAADLYPDAMNKTVTAFLRWMPNGLDGGWEDVRRELSW